MPRHTVPPFTARLATQLLSESCRAVKIDAADARLLRLGENALFHLPAESTVVRIARTMDYWADSVNEVEVSRWLACEEFPAAEVLDLAQPIEISGHPVTFWRYVDGRDGDREDIGTLGAVLRRLHSLSRPTTFSLPNEDILGRIEPRIESANVSQADKEFLQSRLYSLRSELAILRFPLALAPTHGDAHSENIMFRDGVPILIDFERFAWGHPEWDLAMTATEYDTAGWLTATEYESFSSSYGFDVRSWTGGYEVLRRVHELKMTTWLMQNIGESPDVAEEYKVRMRTIRDGVKAAWRPF